MYKQKGNPFEVTSCGRRRNYMTSPLKKAGKIKTKRAPELNQKTKDSLQGEAFKYDKAFYSPKHKVNVDPEDGVLSNRVFYEDGSELKYESIDKPFDSPANKAEPRRTIGKGKNFNKANPTGTGADAGGGMTQKGVNEYKSKNPGSNLKTAVTKKPSQLKPGSKDAKRRKSFCARSKSWKSERGRAARRRWNC